MSPIRESICGGAPHMGANLELPHLDVPILGSYLVHPIRQPIWALPSGRQLEVSQCGSQSWEPHLGPNLGHPNLEKLHL